MNLKESRLLSAEKIFEAFDFGFEISESDTWQYDEKESLLSKVVYSDNGDEDTLKATLAIYFDVETARPNDVSCNLDGEFIGSLDGDLTDYSVGLNYIPENNQSWYHGTATEFDKFDSEYIGKGTDQLGSGFYFTTEEDTAHMYAFMNKDNEEGFLLEVDLTINKPLPSDAFFTREEIKSILKTAPNLDDVLWDFGDWQTEGKEKTLNTAVETYYTMNNGDYALDILNTMSNDFFRDEEALFLDKVTEVTGYDGLYREKNGQTHAVVWNPSQINIKNVINLTKNPVPSL